jgi:ABC-type lipoprotein export system ATPase subunit
VPSCFVRDCCLPTTQRVIRNAAWAGGVFSTIRRAAGEGTSCLIPTHNEELLEYADRVVGIRDGRVEAVQVEARR